MKQQPLMQDWEDDNGPFANNFAVLIKIAVTVRYCIYYL